jgi:hypothetical protein
VGLGSWLVMLQAANPAAPAKASARRNVGEGVRMLPFSAAPGWA